jgi:hypothetical protein
MEMAKNKNRKPAQDVEFATETSGANKQKQASNEPVKTTNK